MTNEISIKLDILSGYMGSRLTDEQKEFASDFRQNTVSFSDPGTGKTHTLIAGLVFAQDYYKIPGSLINCMSFTNEAVNEMAARYAMTAKKCDVPNSVVFNTFHRLSRQILKDAYPHITKIKKSNFGKSDLEDMKRYLEEAGVSEVSEKLIKQTIRVMESMNSSLTFHPDNLKTKYDFVSLGLDIDAFQEIRTNWFLKGINDGCIAQGDIPLYCLYALMKKEDLAPKWKGKYRIMVVDEFQDLSLLNLRILSFIANTLIVIGDMKQQIYAFNGACPQIVREYMKLRPDARVCNLTNSFRCGQEIAEFATNLIKPNDPTIKCFTGHTRGSSVDLIRRRDMDWSAIADSIVEEVATKGKKKATDYMFLYRNNASAAPIIEELYKREIPFRCTAYRTVMETPVFETLTTLAQVAWQPKDIKNVSNAVSLFPEFRKSTGVPPVVYAMQKSGKDFFEVNYTYREGSSYAIIDAMRAARMAILDNKSAGVVYMKLYDAYKKYLRQFEWWKLENDDVFYFNLMAPICNNKTYPQMYNEELDKIKRNEDCINANTGIRLYTMHSSKGLEADVVVILDCDEGIFPNAKKFKNMVDAGCLMDAAVAVRSERNLLYVAVTRAKNKVIITYSGENPATLVVNPNAPEYQQFDELYMTSETEFDDAEEFFKLFKIGA